MLASTDSEFDKRVKKIVERRQIFESGTTNEFSSTQLSEDNESSMNRSMLGDTETDT